MSAQPVRTVSREILLSVAAGLFARSGYRATTLDDIAAEVGVKKASLYHYIGSKEDLLLDIYRRIFDRINGAVAPIVTLDLPADERLRRMIHAHLGVVMVERDLLAVVFREESELPSKAQSDIRRRKRIHESLFERVIEEGQRTGLLRPGSARLRVLAILGMCNWVYQWYQQDRYEPDDVAAEFAAMAESGWLATPGKGGAWPRYASVSEAMTPVREALDRSRAELDQLESELNEADARLQAGLAGGQRTPRRLNSVRKTT